MTDQNEVPIIKSAQKARGAERGPTVRNVLVISMVAVILAFVVIYYHFFSA